MSAFFMTLKFAPYDGVVVIPARSLSARLFPALFGPMITVRSPRLTLVPSLLSNSFKRYTYMRFIY
ncbi:hypothetical protein WJ23_27755 [Burkholderia lata]|nr:hypothetical protein WJ23_27755 [Burkholderia lata]